MLLELQELRQERYSLLVITKAAELHSALLESLSFFSAKKIPGVYASLTKPTRLLQPELQTKNINLKNIIFMEGMVDESNEYPNVVFIPTLEDLTGITIALESFLKSYDGEKFFIVDSVELLQLFNTLDLVTNFIWKITQLCSAHKTHCLMMVSKKVDDILVKKITPFFEKTLYKT